MLINFSVGNFKSIRDPIFLSMEPGERLTKHSKTNLLVVGKEKFLKTALLFGPNGAGKTNLLYAIRAMYIIIKNPSLDVSEDLFYMPHLLCSDCEDKGTSYLIEFYYNGMFYLYEFTNTRDQILREKMSIGLNRQKYEVYFERDHRNAVFSAPDSLMSLKEKTRENRLFLSIAQNFNDEYCTNVFRWFTEQVLFFDADRISRSFDILNNQPTKQKFIKFLNYAGINAVDIEIRTVPRFSDKLVKELRRMSEDIKEKIELEMTKEELYLVYNKYDSDGQLIGHSQIPYGNESRGTKKLIDIAIAMLISRKERQVMIIDEFDDSLHLGLSQALIQLFNSESNLTQVILSTHQLDLMDENLRIDQIYLVEKDFTGKTKLYSLFDFDEISRVARSDIKFVKRYLSGQFGAVPYIDVDLITSEILGG